MQFSIGNKVETWAIAAIRSFATLAQDLQIKPAASSAETESERLIVKCEVGPQMESGVKPFQCQLSFDLRTAKRSAEDANDIFAKVEAAMKEGLDNATSVAAATAQGFTWLQIFTEEAESEADNTGNFRKFKRAFPLRCLVN